MINNSDSPISPSIRIAIVSASFDPTTRYQEVLFARELTTMGHDVGVFASDKSLLNDGRSVIEKDANAPYRITRIRKYISILKTIIPRDVAALRKFKEFAPQAVMLLAPSHGPGYFWLRHIPRESKVISGFSDLAMHKTSKVFWGIKKSWYRTIFRRSDLIITATNQTSSLLRPIRDSVQGPEIFMCGLGLERQVEPPDFPEVRSFCAKHSVVLSCVTRITPEKRGLEMLFTAVESYLKEHPTSGFIIGGFGEDAHGSGLRAKLAASPVAGQILTLGILGSEEIDFIFNHSLLSLWTQVSIGLQQSIGRGCPVFLRQGQAADHILREGATGVFFPDYETLPSLLAQAVNHPWDRGEISLSIQPFLISSILRAVFERVSIQL